MKVARKIITLVVITLCAISTISIEAKDVRSVRQQRETAKKQLNTSNEKLRKNEAQVIAKLNQLNRIEAEIARQEKKAGAIRQRHQALTRQAQLLADTIREANNQLERMREAYATAVRHTHHSGGKFDQLMFIFASDNFRQAVQRYRYAKQFSAWREKQTKAIAERQVVIEQKREQLQSAAETIQLTLDSLNHNLGKVRDQRAKQATVVAQLQKESKTLKSAIRTQQKKINQLDNELNRMIREEEAKRAREAELEKQREAKRRQQEQEQAKQQKKQDKKQEKQNKPATKPADAPKKPTTTPSTTPQGAKAPSPIEKLSGDFESNKGKLPMPVTGSSTIVKHFGRQRHEQLKNVETNNGGIDIETSKGAKARAIFNGKVTGVFQTADFNNVVMVRHGEYLTIYVNISTVDVKSGQEISAGSNIGTIFSDPSDNHRTILHFEIRKEREKLNPELWLKP